MNEEVGSLILGRLRRMNGRLANIRNDMHDLKLRTTVLEEHLGNVVLSISGLNARMDRFDKRMARVERRLDLTDAH